MPQLNLNFYDIPIPETHLWDEFEEEQKHAVVQALVRLLVKATQDHNQEPTHD
jgi:hypothetical protein